MFRAASRGSQPPGKAGRRLQGQSGEAQGQNKKTAIWGLNLALSGLLISQAFQMSGSSSSVLTHKVGDLGPVYLASLRLSFLTCRMGIGPLVCQVGSAVSSDNMSALVIHPPGASQEHNLLPSKPISITCVLELQ